MEVEIDTANKLCIGAEARGQKLKFAEFGVDVAVNEVSHRRFVPAEAVDRFYKSKGARFHMLQLPGHDGGLPAAASCDLAIWGDGGDDFIGTSELNEVRDIAGGTISEARGDA